MTLAWSTTDSARRRAETVCSVLRKDLTATADALLSHNKDGRVVSLRPGPIARRSHESGPDLNLRDERLLTASEVQRIIGMGRSKVYEMMRRSELSVISLGPRAKRVPLSELMAWIRRHTKSGR